MKNIGRILNVLTAIFMVGWAVCELTHFLDGTANRCTIFVAAMPLVMAAFWARLTYLYWNEDDEDL